MTESAHHLKERLAEEPLGEAAQHSHNPIEPNRAGVARIASGGVLMGLANIIPGVSGGTMILAAGIYAEFVDAVCDLTRLKFRMRSLFFLGLLGIFNVIGIAIGTVPIGWGLETCHHLMYALFIGLTLGGVPMLWKEITPLKAPAISGLVGGLAFMAILTFALRSMSLPDNWFVYLAAGFIASAAMILPGISGSYLLLIFGLYYTIMTAAKGFFKAALHLEWGTAWDLGFNIGLPVALGLVAGIGVLSNVLKSLLKNHHAPTMGALMGLLIGSVLGLYPFKDLVEKGELIAKAHPATPLNIGLVIVGVTTGLAVTYLLSRIGEPKGNQHHSDGLSGTKPLA